MQRPAKPSTSVRFRVPPPVCVFWIDLSVGCGDYVAMKKFTFTLRWPIGDTRVVEWAETLEAARTRLSRKYPACEIFADEDIPVYIRETRVEDVNTTALCTSAGGAPGAERAADQSAL